VLAAPAYEGQPVTPRRPVRRRPLGESPGLASVRIGNPDRAVIEAETPRMRIRHEGDLVLGRPRRVHPVSDHQSPILAVRSDRVDAKRLALVLAAAPAVERQRLPARAPGGRAVVAVRQPTHRPAVRPDQHDPPPGRFIPLDSDKPPLGREGGFDRIQAIAGDVWPDPVLAAGAWLHGADVEPCGQWRRLWPALEGCRVSRIAIARRRWGIALARRPLRVSDARRPGLLVSPSEGHSSGPLDSDGVPDRTSGVRALRVAGLVVASAAVVATACGRDDRLETAERSRFGIRLGWSVGRFPWESRDTG
jgi:hypothetical protein